MSSLGVGRTVQLSTMGSDVESKDGKLPNTPEDDLRELEEAYAALRDESQQLINERTTLEAEVRTLRKRIERLDENVNLLKMPPLIVGHIQDVLDHEALSFAHRTGLFSKFRSINDSTLMPSSQVHESHSTKTASP